MKKPPKSHPLEVYRSISFRRFPFVFFPLGLGLLRIFRLFWVFSSVGVWKVVFFPFGVTGVKARLFRWLLADLTWFNISRSEWHLDWYFQLAGVMILAAWLYICVGKNSQVAFGMDMNRHACNISPATLASHYDKAQHKVRHAGWPCNTDSIFTLWFLKPQRKKRNKVAKACKSNPK